MAFEKSHLNSRAGMWATLIVGTALVTLWVPQLIWPSNGFPNLFALVLSIPGFIVLLPGIMITSYVRLTAYELIHRAEIARAMAAGSNNGYFVGDKIGPHWSIPFVCAVVVDWLLYFLIARTVIRARGQRADN